MKGTRGGRRTALATAPLAVLLLAPIAAASDAPGDIRFERAPGSALEAPVFPHWVHRVRFTCNACHPQPFPMARTLKITLDDIREGRYCGACHNGRVAFAVAPTTCNRCHVASAP